MRFTDETVEIGLNTKCFILSCETGHGSRHTLMQEGVPAVQEAVILCDHIQRSNRRATTRGRRGGGLT